VSAAVISLAQVKAERLEQAKARADAAKPEWGDDIITVALYAQMVRADHDAESAAIRFELRRDHGGMAWFDGPPDIKERVEENRRQWDIYIGLLAHLATLPAQTRNQARVKRDTIGKQWLAPLDGNWSDEPGSLGRRFADMRRGCIADDHLFPPSLKLARASTGE
jgi:hypothetical protein